jgi:hypothetical protein
VNQRIDRQRGWIGMIGLLLALAIVAYLAKDALLKYGMIPSGDTTVIKAGTPGERARMPAAVDASGTIIDSAPAAPTTAIDKARGVENMLKQQESKRSGGY